MFGILFSILVGICGSGVAWADEPLRVVELNIAGSEQLKAGSQDLELHLQKIRTSQELTDEDLNVVHEKKLHLFIFDLGLKEYFHIHPEYKDGAWRASVILPRDGYYRIWAQGQMKAQGDDEEVDFTAANTRQIQGGLKANPLPNQIEPKGEGADGTSVVAFSEANFPTNQMVMPTLTFSRTDGKKPKITPYLGALAHVLIVSIDGDEVIHVHPMEMNKSLMIHTQFKNVGDYRVWVQFVDGGRLRTVPLSFRVKAE